MNSEIPNDMSQGNILDFYKESEENSFIDSRDTKTKLLGRKTKRKQLELLEIQRTRCDICLEFEKYSDNKLIECKKCGGICHKKCGENDVFSIHKLNSNETFKNQIEHEKWICLRCSNSKISPLPNCEKCIICGESYGILNKLNSSMELAHSRCLRFIPELIDSDVHSNLNKKDHSSYDNQSDKIRKWRNKYMCRICKSKETKSRCVIKCANTKCKFYTHIPCAILKNMIIPIDFMTDYYGFSSKDKKIKPIPFYCNLHNRNIIEAYTSYVYQLDQVISETLFNTSKNLMNNSIEKRSEKLGSPIRVKLENENYPVGNSYFTKDIKTEDETKEYDGEISDFNNFYNNNVHIKTNKLNNLDDESNENSMDENFQNIMSLQINFEKNLIEIGDDNLSARSIPINDECNYKESSINLFNQINKILPQKPKYQHDDSITFNLTLPNLIPNSEYNFINIENNNNFNFNFDKEFDSLLLEKIKMENNSSFVLNSSNFDKFSKMFYDYFETDINLMKEQDKSKITVTQIKQLKNFLIKIIKNYKSCDKDISLIYAILKKEGLFKE